MVPPRVSAASAVLLGAALAGIAFGAAGGTELGRTTTVEVLAVLASGALVAVVLYRGIYGGPGSVPLAAFAALAAFTALSVTWSIVPETSYVEAGRTMAYLFVFAGGVALARLAPRRPEIVLGGVLLAAGLASAYALASRVWPATLAENELSNRIGAPFQYWNAVGTTAALAVPALLWLGSRRTGSAALRALAYPALGVSVVAILLTQSRGALAAAGIAAIIWFALVPLRLRSLPVLLVPAAGAGAVSAWALARDAFSQTLQPLSARESVAGDFGLLLLLMVVVLFLAGLAVNVGLARSVASMRVRRRVGIAALAVACAIPLVALTSVAVSDGGLGGSIRDRVDQLTSETDTAPQQGAGRLTAVSSTRGKYWREAGRVFDDRPVAGVGAGAFEVARLRHRSDAAVTRHAHGYPVQTLADLGIIGLALSLPCSSPGWSPPPAPRGSTRAGCVCGAPRTRCPRGGTGTASASRSPRWHWWRSSSGCSPRSTGPGSCPDRPRWRSWPPGWWPGADPWSRWAGPPSPSRPRSPRRRGLAAPRAGGRGWDARRRARGLGAMAARGVPALGGQRAGHGLGRRLPVGARRGGQRGRLRSALPHSALRPRRHPVRRKAGCPGRAHARARGAPLPRRSRRLDQARALPALRARQTAGGAHHAAGRPLPGPLLAAGALALPHRAGGTARGGPSTPEVDRF